MQDYAERRALRSELRSLSKEEKQRQQKAVQEVLKHASVVCSTLTGVATFQLRDLTFNLTVVDEAAQVSDAIQRVTTHFPDSIQLTRQQWLLTVSLAPIVDGKLPLLCNSCR